MHIVYPVVVSALLFSIGVYGVLARRNAILVLISVELMLNAVNLNLVAFDIWLRDRLHPDRRSIFDTKDHRDPEQGKRPTL